ncbi:MAG: hypothetical protein ACTTJS_01760 [Wolinella sp.]
MLNYIKHNDFKNITSIVMDKNPDKKAWEIIKYHVFYVPDANGVNCLRDWDHYKHT